MGSLVSAPKNPRPVVTQTPATPQAPTTPTTVNTSETPAADPREVQDTQSIARAKSLLARGRSRFGTIATGFRGLLQENSKPARKTLLGE